MINEHKVFHDRIQAWLSGHLDAEATEAFRAHQIECADCAARAQSEKNLWEMLGAGKIEDQELVPSVWPQVREKVFKSAIPAKTVGSSWFFGGGQLVRASLAACAVSAGLMVGILTPGVSNQANAENTSNKLWDTESSWLDATSTDGLAGIWLDPGLSDESDGS